MHEYYAASAANSSKPIVIAINRRIELVVAPKRYHPDHVACLTSMSASSRRLLGQMRFALPVRFSICAAVPANLSLESLRLPHAPIKILEILGIGGLNRFTNSAVVRDPAVPVYFWIRSQGRLSNFRHYSRLG